MVGNKITLNFEIEKGEPIDRYYFSARMKLTDESKNLLRKELGNSIQLNSLDSYFDLNPENFYIYHNPYGNRDELYVKDNDSKYLTSNLPLNHYGFSVELSPDGSSIADYGFYPLSVIYNPDHYNKAQEKVKVFGDSDLLSTTSEKALSKLLSNRDSLTTQEIFSHLQNEVAEKEAKLAREKRHAEEELSKKNEELKDLIEKGEINLFKVIKGHDIDSQRSAAVLKLDDKEITLDSDSFYIAEYEGSEFLHCTNSDYDMLLGHDDLFFVLNKSSYPDLANGFYSIPDDSYASYLKAEHHYLSDSQVSEKLSKVLEGSNEVVVETQSSHVEQPEEEVEVEKPKSAHRIKKRELREEDVEEHKIVSPDLDVKDSHGYTALHKAVFNKHFDEVKSLVEQGAKVDVQDKHEITPLSYAVMNNDWTMVRFLVETGNASVSLGKYNNPLSMAIARKYTELAEYLIKKGADVDQQDGIGRTLLHKAAENGNLDIVKFLVEKGARLDVLDKWNDTPLHVAANVKANKGHLEVVSYLIKEGADVNLTHNYTPIHLAITRGNLDMVKCLMDNSADLYIERKCDGTPLAYAKQQGQTEIVNYMDSVMSNLSHNKTISFSEADINIKYDLASNKLDIIEKSIKNAIQDFKSAFNTSDHNIKINAYIFNTQNDFKEYLKKVGFDAGNGVTGYTKMIDLSKGNAADVYIYLDKGNLDQHTLEHEIGHAMHFANLGLSYILPKAMHEAIANYTAGLENGEHVNDHEDIKALSAIKSKDLKPDEILRNDYQGGDYYSEAEQVVKFLEHKHPDLIDNLLKSLSSYGYSDRPQANKLVEDFLMILRGYGQEFKGWVADQISSESSSVHQKSVDEEQMQADSSASESSSDHQKRGKRSAASDEDEDQEESVIASVIGSMNDGSDSQTEEKFNEVASAQHPPKIKAGGPLEMGKYKVEMQVTYNDVTNFYDTIKNKYHTSKEYNYEQVMVLYNNVIVPVSQHYEEPVTLAESYIANGHLFIKNQDFGTLNDFNEMFYKSDELI